MKGLRYCTLRKPLSCAVVAIVFEGRLELGGFICLHFESWSNKFPTAVTLNGMVCVFHPKTEDKLFSQSSSHSPAKYSVKVIL